MRKRKLNSKLLSMLTGVAAGTLTCGMAFAVTPVAEGGNAHGMPKNGQELWTYVSNVAEPEDMEILAPYMDQEILSDINGNSIVETLSIYCEHVPEFESVVGDYFQVQSM